MSFLDRLGQKLGQLVDDIAVPDSIREDLEQGKAALDAGDPGQAERHLRRAVRTAPDHARAWHLLGLSELRQDRPELAITSLGRALELSGDDFTLLLALAEAQRAADETQAAIASYKRALAGRVDQRLLDRVYGGLGEIYLAQGQVDRAVRELRKAVASSQGQDLRLVGLLGLAQLGDRDLDLARQSLSRAAAAVPPDRAVLLGLARVLLELAQPEQARLAAVRLLQEHPKDTDARCLLARALLEQRSTQAAHQELLQALEQSPRSFEVHRLLAQVHLQAHDVPSAIRQLQTALSFETHPPEMGTDPRRQLLALLLEQGIDTPQGGTDPCLTDEAHRVLEREPDDSLALACLAVGSPTERARELVARALQSAQTYFVRLAQAQVELAAPDGDLALAGTALRAALRLSPEREAARRLLARTYDRMSGGPDPGDAPVAFYPALRHIHHLLSQPGLAHLAPEVVRIQEVFDRPLLLVVMGEFNSGKSTFVNALIGEKVAPMGVTPTTATINVLKYGERRAARVLWRDDREQELSWDEVASFLRGLDRRQARAIRVVELLYPSEELLRVNVVDTPGLNSMIDEHEETAREYMTQADAVIWLFCAGQAGKQTELQALELLRQHRLKTVGVLNKVDCLAPDELAQVLEHLQQEFLELVEAVIPVAARPALEALVAADRQLLEESGFPQLRRFLEQQIFSGSRRIKREVCQRRLDEVLRQALGQASQLVGRADHAIDQVDAVGRILRDQREDQQWLERERAQLRASLQQVYQDGAAEVLDFVRPRRWVFGEHQATRADRDFLLDSLMDGLIKMGDASAARVVERLERYHQQQQAELRPTLSGGLSPLCVRLEALEQAVRDRQSVVRQQVYGRYQAFARGYLQGGRVDRFFEQQLPKLELGQEPVYRALVADSVDLDRELLAPLASWYRETLDALLLQLTRLRTEIDLVRLEQDRRILAPLAELQHRLGRIDEVEACDERP